MSDIMLTKYSDLDLSLRPNPLTGDIIVLKDKSAVRESIIRVLSSSAFDIYNNPNISSLEDYVFENMSNPMIASMKENIRFNLEKYEKRIKVNNVDINVDKMSQSISLKINYELKDLEIADDLTYVVKRKV